LIDFPYLPSDIRENVLREHPVFINPDNRILVFLNSDPLNFPSDGYLYKYSP
jgi:hypothetical protein